MLTLAVGLFVFLAVPIYADNVELTSNLNQTRQFTCPGDLVTFTCRVLQSRSLEWRSPLITQTTLFLGDAAPQSQAMLPRGPFTASLTERSGTFVNSNFTSTLQVTASRMFMRNETTVMCLSSTMESETDNFTVAEIPTAPRNVEVSAERIPSGGSITIRANLTWMRPQNFDQFDIDRYDINVTSTSGIQNMITACGECTSAMATVSGISNMPMNTDFTFTIAAVNLCGETGPVGTTVYNLMISQSAGTRVRLPLWAILLAAIGVLVLLSQDK